MAISGYALTLTGGTTGALAGDIQDVTVGGISVDFSEVKQVSDTNRIPENLPLTVREAPMEVTMTYDETLYNTLRTNLIALTEETWTLTGSDSSTHVGTGFIAAVSGLSMNTDGHAVYTVTLQPKTSWSFTAV
jgi:hypothetical protein